MFQLIIKSDDDIIVRVQNSDASNFKYSVLVVVIVVHYYCSIQSSVLGTNQDFHTQMWPEKSDLGTMNKNGFNSGPDLNVSQVPRAGFDITKRSSARVIQHIRARSTQHSTAKQAQHNRKQKCMKS